MRPDERDPARIWHMIEACRKTIRMLQGVSAEEFLGSEDLQDLAVYRLQVLGEAANQVTAGLRLQHPEVPWRDIVNKRHVLVHGYDRIDYARVWAVVRNELTPLVDQLESILRSLDPERR